jgi:hypothetical protein
MDRQLKTGWLVVGAVAGFFWLLTEVRHQGWRMHQECLAEALRQHPEPGSQDSLREIVGLGPEGNVTPGQFAANLLYQNCTKPR